MTTLDWHTWIGKSNPKDFLDPANWKDGKVPPKRGASVFVPSGSKLEVEPPPGMAFAAWYVESDPPGTVPEDCTYIGRTSVDRFEKVYG